jgi:membrane protein implicated in regulation of membrane protease activity
MGDLGRFLMIAGGVLFAVGLLLTLAGRLPWLGRLPGDIVIERGPVTFYFPLATSIIVSVALTLLFWLFRR